MSKEAYEGDKMAEKEDEKHSSSNSNYERRIYKDGGTQNKVSDESRDIDKEGIKTWWLPRIETRANRKGKVLKVVRIKITLT